ncbi:hypothetical protein ILUMI_19526 [Ignelater luminosus]|uniref:Uncharacterized protein n=1 Tax=Ignelater luminosus TaxID=2038154 RepID=A0A8K0G351_IGNLU|nr:hypothetical protein ILUMI_19526 [Ignelater luminosus]
MLNHPGKPISIYDAAQLVGNTLPLAFTTSNITTGFRVTGIWPFNEKVFGDHEFLPQNIDDALRSEIPSTSVALRQAVSVTPEQIRPFPKALPRKPSGRRRKPGRCIAGPLIFSEGSSLLVRYKVIGRTKEHVCYAGKILDITEEDVSVKFLRKQRTHFAFSNVDDLSTVRRKDIVKYLVVTLGALISYAIPVAYSVIKRTTSINPQDWVFGFGPITVLNDSQLRGESSCKEGDKIDVSRIGWKYLELELHYIVRYHLSIIEIATDLEDIFSYAMLSVYLFALTILCFEVYRAAMVSITVIL